MSELFSEGEREYRVIVNEENQHSFWPGHRDVPPGWVAAYGPADLEQCQKYVAHNWTDMRPKSVIEATK